MINEHFREEYHLIIGQEFHWWAQGGQDLQLQDAWALGV